jgi:hypothetical protein
LQDSCNIVGRALLAEGPLPIAGGPGIPDRSASRLACRLPSRTVEDASRVSRAFPMASTAGHQSAPCVDRCTECRLGMRFRPISEHDIEP